MKTLLLLLSFVFTISLVAVAQEHAYSNEIKNFKKEDSIAPQAKGQILFVGSSSFRMWKNLQSYFPKHHVINRGFGGSTLTDVIYFANDIIFPYQPKQVVIYCGDNDLAASESITADSVANRFERLFSLIRTNLPAAKVSYVSIKPSPSRRSLLPKMVEANTLIKSFLKKQPNTSYIDVFKPMMHHDEIRSDIFMSDSLHMNEKGYTIWQKKIKKHLED